MSRHVGRMEWLKADTKNKRHRIADPYLRFWLAFLQRGIPLVERGRGDILLERIEGSWPSWRGRAVEPVVRESLLRLLPSERRPEYRNSRRLVEPAEQSGAYQIGGAVS